MKFSAGVKLRSYIFNLLLYCGACYSLIFEIFGVILSIV